MYVFLFFSPFFDILSPSLCERFSIYPLGGVFCRRGTTKLVEQGASYSEGYIRYLNSIRGLKYYLHPPHPLSQSSHLP